MTKNDLFGDLKEASVYMTIAGISLLIILTVSNFGMLIYLTKNVKKLRRGRNNNRNDDDADSFDDDDETNKPQQYTQPYVLSDHYPQMHQNPYNPNEGFTVHKKLIQSLRNKISNSPRRSPSRDEIEIPPAPDYTDFPDEEYPHPKHGTLKNEILTARSRMAKKKAPAPPEWTNNIPKPPGDPPRDYPGFQGPNRRPYGANNFGPPVAPKPRGLTRQENDVMAEYDRTIANQERPYGANPGFLHNRYPNSATRM